jgi:hypothetical protein
MEGTAMLNSSSEVTAKWMFGFFIPFPPFDHAYPDSILDGVD